MNKIILLALIAFLASAAPFNKLAESDSDDTLDLEMEEGMEDMIDFEDAPENLPFLA